MHAFIFYLVLDESYGQEFEFNILETIHPIKL